MYWFLRLTLQYLVSSAENDRATGGNNDGDGTGPINAGCDGGNVSPAPTCELEMELTGSLHEDDDMGEDFAPLFEDI